MGSTKGLYGHCKQSRHAYRKDNGTPHPTRIFHLLGQDSPEHQLSPSTEQAVRGWTRHSSEMPKT